jgi:hypothetical protein
VRLGPAQEKGTLSRISSACIMWADAADGAGGGPAGRWCSAGPWRWAGLAEQAEQQQRQAAARSQPPQEPARSKGVDATAGVARVAGVVRVAGQPGPCALVTGLSLSSSNRCGRLSVRSQHVRVLSYSTSCTSAPGLSLNRPSPAQRCRPQSCTPVPDLSSLASVSPMRPRLWRTREAVRWALPSKPRHLVSLPPPLPSRGLAAGARLRDRGRQQLHDQASSRCRGSLGTAHSLPAAALAVGDAPHAALPAPSPPLPQLPPPTHTYTQHTPHQVVRAAGRRLRAERRRHADGPRRARGGPGAGQGAVPPPPPPPRPLPCAPPAPRPPPTPPLR